MLAALLLPQTLFAATLFHAPLPLSSALDAGASSAQEASIDFAAFEPLPEISSIRADIEALVQRGDSYSPLHAELSAALGQALQAEGRHEEALQAFDTALQLQRRLEGLYSHVQTTLLQAKIESQLALGQRAEADTLHTALYAMQRSLYAGGAVALAEAHMLWADWNVLFYLGARAQALPGGHTDAFLAALDERLAKAFADYHKSLDLLAGVADADQAERRIAIERRIAGLMALANKQYLNNMPNTLTKQGLASSAQSRRANHPALLRHGSLALRRAITHESNAEVDKVAQRQLELADWYLLMNQHEEAWSTYAAALALLQDSGLGERQQLLVLQPGMPLHDPVAELQALMAQSKPPEAEGYVDVAFDVDAQGRARNARIVAGRAYDARVEQELLLLLRDEAFRPGFAHGKPLAQQQTQLRYYFTRQ